MIQAFAELLSVCRQVTSRAGVGALEVSSPNTTASSDIGTDFLLASSVLDVLLCVLVDSTAGLRTFEDVKGVEQIAKLMRRLTIPRDVR